MIRLIAADCDGTLMPEGTMDLDPAYYEEIRRLHRDGILFAAVSGREYNSLSMLMKPVEDIVVMSADNGGSLWYGGKQLFSFCFELPLAIEVIRYSRTLPGVEYSFLSTEDGAVTDSTNDEIIQRLKRNYNEEITRIPDACRISRSPMKIALYTPGDSKDLADPARAFFGDRVDIVESGTHWVDFVPKGVSKGNSLRYIQDHFGITKEETVAFGDNTNDISMFEAAGQSYAVAEAREPVKQAADRTIGSFRDLSVLRILREY